MKKQDNLLHPFKIAFKIIKKIFLLEIDVNLEKATETVESGIEMRGSRLWFLLASCVIASIGLNTNSSTVVIGAMLISPLMGPILGLGFGMATVSRSIIRSSLENLAFSVLLTLAVASVYFFVSPFQEPTHEILTRISPNLLDLLVAIAAAFAGVVAMNLTTLSGAIPGVAIATAIMPPLCSSAYGIAHGDWKIALGAFYLFLVNAIAIAVIAFLLFKRMHFPVEIQQDPKKQKLRPTIISFIVVLIVLPLSWSLWEAWQDDFKRRSIARLVESYTDKLEIISWNWGGSKTHKLTLYDFKKISPDMRIELQKKLNQISPKAILEVHENRLSSETEGLVSQITTSGFSTLLSNPKIIKGLVKLASGEQQARDLMEQVLTSEHEFNLLLGNRNLVRAYLGRNKNASEVLLRVRTANASEAQRIKREIPRYQTWLKNRFPKEVMVQIEVN